MENCKDKKKVVDYNINQKCLEVIGLAFEVFGNRKRALSFILKKHSELNNTSPLKAIENGHANRVIQILHGLEYGFYL